MVRGGVQLPRAAFGHPAARRRHAGPAERRARPSVERHSAASRANHATIPARLSGSTRVFSREGKAPMTQSEVERPPAAEADDPAELRRLYEQMVLLRKFDERVGDLFR